MSTFHCYDSLLLIASIITIIMINIYIYKFNESCHSMSIQVSQDLFREKNSKKVASRDDSAGWASRGPLSGTFKHG